MLHSPRALAVASFGVVFLLALAGVSAQDARSKPSPGFRSGVDLLVLDVSVLDRDRRPVSGLTAGDFTVLEDGQPQAVAAFGAVDLPDADDVPGLAPWTRDVPSDVRRNTDFNDRRIVVIVMDDATPMPAADVPNARTVARHVIDELGPADLACVVFALNKGHGQEFTTDRAKLLDAVGRFNGTAANMLRVDRSVDRATRVGTARTVPFDELDTAAATLYFSTIGTLRGVTESLAALPDRRKALVFISTGIPLDLARAADDPSGVVRQIGFSLQEVFRAAQRANVNVYPLDPGGLRASYDRAVSSADPANPGALNRDFLEELAGNTGGVPAVDTNDVVPVVRQMRRENSSYYLLGYTPSNRRREGRFRAIVVRVNRPGVTVRTRSGYYEPVAASKAATRPAPVAAGADAASLLPKTDLTMQVCAMPFAVAGKVDAGVAIVVGIRQPTPRRLTRLVYAVNLRVDAYSPDGRRRGSSRAMVPVTLNQPGVGLPVGFELLTTLDLPPGRYQLRLAAESSLHGVRVNPNAPEVGLVGLDADTDAKSGSVHSDLDVPDFQRAPLSLSGVALSVVPAVASGPPGALSPLVPVVPTTLRDFSSEDQVTGFVRITQGAARAASPVTLTLRIVDGRGAAVVQTSETIGPERFAASRLVDHPFNVPLQQLVAGPHLLVLEAVAGDDRVTREVRFSLQR